MIGIVCFIPFSRPSTVKESAEGSLQLSSYPSRLHAKGLGSERKHTQCHQRGRERAEEEPDRADRVVEVRRQQRLAGRIGRVGDYRQAAQSFLKGYREYPKSRKAADSLLKLGLSLNRLGQKEQACAAFTQLGGQFPKAAEARKRAQTEAKRAGCAA